MKGFVDIIFGGNAGSEGKGKFAGYFALKNNYQHAVTNHFPNAGHTWVGDDGEIVKTRYLPIALINKDIQLYLGPGSAIDLNVLEEEIENYEEKYKIRDRLHIHPNAAIINKIHIGIEKMVGLGRIASTLRGGSAALALKAMRMDAQERAIDIYSLKRFISKTEEKLFNALKNNENIIIEGAQGFDLDLNYGYSYPYTTSRQTTPAQLLADAGLPISSVRHIYAVIRTYPIRVGDPVNNIGTSGPLGGMLISWDIIKERCKCPEEIDLAENERTTVSRTIRRVFEPDIDRLQYMVSMTKPTFLCLNFMQYIDYTDLDKTDYESLSQLSKDEIQKIEKALNMHVSFIGTGQSDSKIIIR